MAFIRWNRTSLLRETIVGLLIFGLTFGGTVWAQPMTPAPGDQRQDEDRPGDQKKNTKQQAEQKTEARKAGDRYPASGVVSAKISGNYDTVHFGQHEYIFQEGVFYSRDSRGFRVVDPPRGAIVRTLPVGYEILMAAGITYFVFAGVYYNRADTGYVVVEAPPVQTTVVTETAVVETGKILSVDTALLNVRSGPGQAHSVVSQVRSGDNLTVQGTSGEWYYVLLPDGSYGWVMAKFTHTLFPEAQG